MILFVLLGLFVGFAGTALGLGGGIILTPVILHLYPELKPEEVTAISLFCIAINASSGSISYFFKRKVHIPSMILFTLASIPGALLGVQLTSVVNRISFELIFGIFLILIGVFLILRKPPSHIDADMAQWGVSKWRYALGIVVSFFVGVIASFLGIGGGIIHVPLLVETMLFPVHTAIATSHSILAFSAITGTAEHYSNGTLLLNGFVLYIALGILIGSPLGAKFSAKMKGSNIMKLIGLVVIIVGIKFLYTNLTR